MTSQTTGATSWWLTAISSSSGSYIGVISRDFTARRSTRVAVGGRKFPRRPHEPYGHTALRLTALSPRWLREGVRFWLSFSLTYDLYTWTTCLTRARSLASTLGKFAVHHAIANPALVADPADLRPLMMQLVSWMRSPAAAGSKRSSTGLTPGTIGTAQSTIQRFYTFMVDHCPEAVKATGDSRWAQLSSDYTRLWPPEAQSPARRANRDDGSWMSQQDLQQMLTCLPILSTPPRDTVTVTLPGGRDITTNGLGDPQAERAWLLQAMTGRRASEILLLDYNPLRPLNSPTPATASTSQLKPEPGQQVEPDTFVARLKYQQTKIAGVDATILVEQSVVDAITAQQRWVTAQLGQEPPYLFVSMRRNYQGLRPRHYESQHEALRRLDDIVGLVDQTGQPLRFTQTHRLRHTRATELLNAGVPVHVVQRYLGHRSPEMTMRYAHTLAAVAEAEFLRYKKIGADARELEIDPHDLYEQAQLDRRTDRILPNGYCMLPPTQACDRGNACLTCSHFATDHHHITAMKEQRDATTHLIEQRQAAFIARHGEPMTSEHVWLAQRQRELEALDAIIERLSDESDNLAIRGAGTHGRTLLPLTPVATDGAHQQLLTPQQPERNDRHG